MPPLPDQPPVVYPLLPQPPLLPDKPEVVLNTGPFIDPDSRSITPFEDQDRPVRNTGAFVDPNGPPDANLEASGTVQDIKRIPVSPP